MAKCSKCGKINEGDGKFCENCGQPLEQGKPEAINNAALSRVEIGLYFKIARGFAWVVSFIAVVALMGAAYYVVRALPDLMGGNTKVETQEIKLAIEADKIDRGNYNQGTSGNASLDPALMASLDKEIYEVINNFPPERRGPEDIEKYRRELKEVLEPYNGINNKIAILRESKELMLTFPMEDRIKAVGKYFSIKIDKIRTAERKKDEAKKEIYYKLGAIGAAILTITIVSLILVLLAIERNTRRKGSQP